MFWPNMQQTKKIDTTDHRKMSVCCCVSLVLVSLSDMSPAYYILQNNGSFVSNAIIASNASRFFFVGSKATVLLEHVGGVKI